MAISKTQFCVNLLSEFFKPAGNIIPKSQLVTDNNRPLLNARINQGFKISDTGTVVVELQGINYQPGKNLFTQDCFEFNCFEEEGLEGAYINIGTDICLVQSTRDNPYMTPEQRAQNNTTCFLDSFGKKRYFVRGTSDIFDYVYVADIGIVNITSGFFTVLDANVPFYSTNEPGSIFARSIRKIPYGVKAVRIKRVSLTNIEIIGTVYGQLDQEFYFPHSIIKPNRSFTYEGQQIKLEDLSINLLLMSSFKRFEIKANQIIYRNINYSSPELENIVFKSGQVLSNLINNDVVPQRGSVPKFITSYLNSEDQYNSRADEQYLNLITDCFSVGCFQPDCFEQIINNSLIERTIDNRAIAWLIQFMTSYAINYNVNLTEEITKLIEYIIRQKNPSNKLYYKGWDQIEEECVELATEDLQDLQTEFGEDICLEGEDPESTSLFYNNSLQLNSNIVTSTNVAIFLALLKAFEYTQDFNYIVEADELFTAINKYLVNSSNLFQHSLSIANTSIESATYQLILNLVTEEYGSINELIAFFKARLFATPEPLNAAVQVGPDDVFVGTDLVITPEIVIDADADNKLFTLTEFDEITSSEDIFKFNYLAFSSFKFLNNKVSIPFLETIVEKYAIIEQSVVDNRANTSLIFALGCLIDNDSFLGFNNIRFNSLLDFNNYRFQKDVMFNTMLLRTPKDYNWFNPAALTRGTHVGGLLYSFAKSLARVNAEYEKIQRSLSIDELYGVLLNQKAEDYNLVRFNKEEDQVFRTRIKNEIFTRAITRPNIESKLKLFNSEVSINDNYPAVVSYETSDDELFNTAWGVGYLQGPNIYNTNIVTFNFAQPIEADVYQEIQNMKPAGIKLELVEVYTFRVASFIGGGGTAITVTDINAGCDNLDLETGDDILLEDGNRICLEDEETVLLPVVLDPPVLPPLDEPIITDDPNSCDCLSLRGFITINTVATEVRNMRTINGGTDYDVNITNETTEPCNLAIETYLQNDILEYLEITPDPFPVDVAALGDIKNIITILDSSETSQRFTIATVNNGSDQVVIWREGALGFDSSNISVSNNIEAIVTTNFILILDKSNNNLFSVNKITMNVTSVTFSPATAQEYRLVSLNSTTVGIYSAYPDQSMIIYHYRWSGGAPAVQTLNTVTLTDPYYVIYYKEGEELKRFTELTNTSTEIYNTPNFDELGTVEHSLTTLSTSPTVSQFIHHEGKNYQVRSEAFINPFGTVGIYQNMGDIIRRHSSDTVLSVLDYGPPPDYSFADAGLIVPFGNFYFIQGSNNAYSFGSNTLQTINSLRCAGDTVSLPSNATVQSIAATAAGVIVTTVDLLNEEWERFIITPVIKTC